VGQVIDVDGPAVYARARFGQPFVRATSTYWADLTTDVYACGVAIPGEPLAPMVMTDTAADQLMGTVHF
jgi:hypothetical protein